MGSKKKTQPDQDDNVSSDRPVVTLVLMESLMEAQGLANELKSYLQLQRLDRSPSSMDPLPQDLAGAGGLPALVEGISQSLSRAITLLLQSQSTGRWRAPVMVDHAGAKQMMLSAPAPAPARRGCGGYKRRRVLARSAHHAWPGRTLLSQGRRKELRSSMDDGYSWRKHGQKEIFGAKYPRSYFRCKHRFEQLCPATRQVQRSEEDPSMLEITYIGDHTCTQQRQHPSTMAGAASNSSMIKHEDVPSPSTEKIRRDHQTPADHDDGTPVHLNNLDGSFPYVTGSDLQMMALEHAGDDVIFDGRCYTTDTYYTAAGDEYADDELAAAASTSFGAFTAMGALDDQYYMN